MENSERIDYVQYIIIDLFCGAGGTSIGFEQAEATHEAMYAFLKSVGITPPPNKEVFFKVSRVVACVNHDPIAIKSHWANHPHVKHFEEDIRLLNPYGELRDLVEHYRKIYPHAKILLWASLECTNFSKAKGGESRDQDSRTLAYGLEPYVDSLKPDYIMIENVVEFMAWGPMVAKTDKTEDGYQYCPLKYTKKKKGVKVKGKKQEYTTTIGASWIPESKNKGKDWMKWRALINSFGYYDEWKQINSADHGALTSRNRLFGCFAKHGLRIIWPQATHAKNPDKVKMFRQLEKWKAVKPALDFADEGKSIFNRTKRMPKVKRNKSGYQYSNLNVYNKRYKTFGPIPNPLSPKSFERLYKGCVKHIAGGNDKFLSKAFGGNPDDKNISVNGPAGTITTKDHHQIINANYLVKYNGNDKETGSPHAGHSIHEPAPVVTTQNRLGIVKADVLNEGFVQKYYTTGGQHNSIDEPAATIRTKDTLSLVQATFIDQRNGHNPEGRSSSINEPAKTLTKTGGNLQIISAQFINQQFTQGKQNQSVEEPLGAITTVPKSNIVTAHYLDKQYSGSDNHQSIDAPAGSILSNDKHSLIQADKFIMSTNFGNSNGHSIQEPAPTLLASRHHHYLINPSWFNEDGARSIDEPCFVVVARQDKAPIYMITCTTGPVVVPVYEDDCEYSIKLKEFMALYNICDIKMRMLKVIELKKIQGFPDEYILHGNQTDQKKFIGNAVVPGIPKAMIEALSEGELEPYRIAA